MMFSMMMRAMIVMRQSNRVSDSRSNRRPRCGVDVELFIRKNIKERIRNELEER